MQSRQPVLAYATIMLAIEGFGAITRRYYFSHIHYIFERLREFATINAQHDRGSTLRRVMLTRHTVGMFLSRALNI
ncbi:hypothetical protein PHMEG_0006639 [Phytophthora megakarya]|uniref:Uncharacterized protein n=1 Tax=Phytophthora megakarya TaxID=4795 RepID=A0A225WQ71_9STRA|nr:hypothetical protein PHMEG_0006639 [Phytophthora megakarya]